METDHNIKDKLFVTENQDFLCRRYSLNKQVSLESFFPGIGLVNLDDCLEIMDLFAKTHDQYLRAPNARMNKGFWYWIYFRWKIPHYNVAIPASSSLTTQNDILHAFGKNICYLLIAVDELGKLHYLKSDDEVMTLFHFNYLISLITSIFDNLAVHTYEKYSIKFPSHHVPSRISLKNNGGKEFLKEVEKQNIDLRNHIRTYANFINLIDKLRNRVVHARGLKEIGFYLDFKMSSVILINSDEEGMIRSSGDKPGPYRILSEWGVYNYVPGRNYFFVDPYFFARSATRLILRFADEFLKLAGHKKFLDNLNPNDDFSQLMNEFQKLSLRGIEQ
jgi:hypothetical protein